MKSTKRKSTGTNATASAGSSSRSNGRLAVESLPPYPFFALCVDNADGAYDLALRLGKVYKVIRPERNDGDNDFRVIDEEGEDYLYPKSWFVPLGLLPREKRRVAAALVSAGSE
jgi:hypothetical protein